MATNIGIGLSTEKNPTEAVKEALYRAGVAIKKEKIDLAIVFSSMEFAQANTLKTIVTLLGAPAIFGSSSTGIICNQGIFKYGLVIMLLNMPEGMYFNTALVRDVKEKSALNSGEELGGKLLYGARELRRDLSIVFSDISVEESSNLMYGLQEKLGRSFPLVGVSLLNSPGLSKTHLYSSQGVFSDSCAGILWGGRLTFGLGIKHGWKPLGKLRNVSKSSGNIIYEINGAPAIRIYEEYLAKDAAQLKKELPDISTLYPIGIYLPDEEEYLLRNVISTLEDGSLLLRGDVPPNSQMRLMIATKESCLGAVSQAIAAAKRGLSSRTADFVFVFESLSRSLVLRRQAQKELEIIKEGFGRHTPIIGLYTNGEQAPLRSITNQGQTYFHNNTITLLAMGGLS